MRKRFKLRAGCCRTEREAHGVIEVPAAPLAAHPVDARRHLEEEAP
ncbi:hypothetical protein ACFV97_29700 [Streptomyces sp. NPDC059913]|jgi:hypothetical protein